MYLGVNALTASRALFGLGVIITASHGHFATANLIGASALITELDGTLARKFKVTSKIGAIRDNLADKSWLIPWAYVNLYLASNFIVQKSLNEAQALGIYSNGAAEAIKMSGVIAQLSFLAMVTGLSLYADISNLKKFKEEQQSNGHQ